MSPIRSGLFGSSRARELNQEENRLLNLRFLCQSGWSGAEVGKGLMSKKVNGADI